VSEHRGDRGDKDDPSSYAWLAEARLSRQASLGARIPLALPRRLARAHGVHPRAALRAPPERV